MDSFHSLKLYSCYVAADLGREKCYHEYWKVPANVGTISGDKSSITANCLYKNSINLWIQRSAVIYQVHNLEILKIKKVSETCWWNCTKNHIPQVLQYHGKLKKKESKCHLSIKLLAEKETIFGITKKFKQELFSNQ